MPETIMDNKVIAGDQPPQPTPDHAPAHGHNAVDPNHKPAEHAHKPAEHEHKTAEHQHAAAEHTPKPAEHEHKPTEHAHKPAEHEHKPSEHAHKPVEHEHKAHAEHEHPHKSGDSHQHLNIIGGGISGLSAAYYAMKKGVPAENIHIYEATGRAGGQIRTEMLQGRVVNKGAEFIDSDQYKMLELCEELGVKLKTSDDQGTLRFNLPDGRVMEGDEFLAAYKPISEQIIAHKEELKRNPTGALAKTIENMTMDQYIDTLVDKAPKPERTFFQQLYDMVTFSENRPDPNIAAMIKQAYASEAGNNPETINALQFVNEASGELDGILASDCGYRVDGGTEKIIEALRRELDKHGVHFHTNSPVESVSKQADGKIELKIGGEKPHNATSDKVIFALPTYALSKLNDYRRLPVGSSSV